MESVMETNNSHQSTLGDTVANISLLIFLPNEKCKRISAKAASYPKTYTIGQLKDEMIPLINTEKELGK